MCRVNIGKPQLRVFSCWWILCFLHLLSPHRFRRDIRLPVSGTTWHATRQSTWCGQLDVGTSDINNDQEYLIRLSRTHRKDEESKWMRWRFLREYKYKEQREVKKYITYDSGDNSAERMVYGWWETTKTIGYRII